MVRMAIASPNKGRCWELKKMCLRHGFGSVFNASPSTTRKSPNDTSVAYARCSHFLFVIFRVQPYFLNKSSGNCLFVCPCQTEAEQEDRADFCRADTCELYSGSMYFESWSCYQLT